MKFRLLIDEKAEESVTVVAHKKSLLTDALENTVREYYGEDELIAYSNEKMRTVAFIEIECVWASEGKCEMIDKYGERYVIKERLYEVEERLPSYFIRINKSAVANERAIKCFNTEFSGGVTVDFKCGHSDYVSRRCFAEIKRRFKKK